MNNKKIIFHIDANYFFARCEEIRNEKLKLVPFVISSNNKRGVISTSNMLARKLGINSGDKLKNFLNIKNLKIIEPDHKYYHQKSHELFNAIRNFLNTDIEIASIDECYVDVSHQINNYHNNFLLLASELKKYVFDTTKIYVSIGIGENKFLAKTANEYKSKNDINHIFKNEIKDKVWNLNIKKIYMVGKKTAIILNNLNIHYVKDFINYENKNQLIKLLKSKYWLLNNYFYGIDNNEDIITHDELPKSISSGETFLNNTSDELFLKNKINCLFDDIYSELNNLNLKSKTITVSIKYNYKLHKSKSKTISDYTNDKNILFNNIIDLFYRLWENQEIRSISLCFSNLKASSEVIDQIKYY